MATYIEDIFNLAVANISQGGSVSNVVNNNDGTFTFTTDNLGNAVAGLDVIINDVRTSIVSINTKLKKITVSSEVVAGVWVLALFFRFGHRKEINETLKSNNKNDTYINKNFPFIWLFSDYKKEGSEFWDNIEYDTKIKMAFVNVSRKELKANERLTLKFKTVIDKVTDLFFSELNKLPISQYFESGTGLIKGDFYDRFFYGSTDKEQNVFDIITDARECEISLSVKLPFTNCTTLI